MKHPLAHFLGIQSEPTEENNLIAQKLEQLNSLLAEKNRRSRRIWKTVAIVLISFAVISVLLIILSVAAFYSYDNLSNTTVVVEKTEELFEF